MEDECPRKTEINEPHNTQNWQVQYGIHHGYHHSHDEDLNLIFDS